MNKTVIKGIVIVVAIFAVLGAILEATGNDKKSNKLTSAIASPTPASVELSSEQRIEKSIKSEFVRKDAIREIKTTSNEDNSYSVKVVLNGDPNLSPNLTKQSIKKDVSNAFYSLFREDFGVRFAGVTVYYPTVDKYDNKNEEIIYQARLTSDEAKKVDWSKDKSILTNTILPEIWETEADKLNQL